MVDGLLESVPSGELTGVTKGLLTTEGLFAGPTEAPAEAEPDTARVITADAATVPGSVEGLATEVAAKEPLAGEAGAAVTDGLQENEPAAAEAVVDSVPLRKVWLPCPAAVAEGLPETEGLPEAEGLPVTEGLDDKVKLDVV